MYDHTLQWTQLAVVKSGMRIMHTVSVTDPLYASAHLNVTQRALSVTQRALSVTQRALSVTQRALSITQQELLTSPRRRTAG
jgi:hypothetical protein